MKKRSQNRAFRTKNPLAQLNLTPMVDIFAVLLIFLLKSYSTEGVILTSNHGLELPASTSSLQPVPTLTLTLTKEAVFVEDRRVQDLESLEREEDLLIPELAKTLKIHTERQARFLAAVSPQSLPDPRVTILADRTLPFRVLEKVMYTCSREGFTDISLAVYQKAE